MLANPRRSEGLSLALWSADLYIDSLFRMGTHIVLKNNDRDEFNVEEAVIRFTEVAESTHHPKWSWDGKLYPKTKRSSGTRRVRR